MTTSVFDATNNGQDTFAWASEPAQGHSNLDYAILQNNAAHAYFRWAAVSQIPKDATISSARFYVYTAGDWAGSVSLDWNRLADSWVANTLTYNNRPGIFGTAVTVTHSPSGAGFEYEFDVTTAMAAEIAAGLNNGCRVTRSDDGDAVRIWQRESSSPTSVKARLVIVWTTVGQKPSKLSPDGIVGIGKPLLSGFPKNTQAVRVFADPDETGFGSPTWSSGTQAVDAPEFDLADSDFPGTIEGASWWWEISTQDPGDNWSDRSDAVEFTYVPLPELTLTNPSEANPVVTDASFPITWNVSDQKAYRAYITLTDGSGTVIWDSGHIQDADARSVTVPGRDSKGRVILKSHAAGAYRVWLESFPSDTLDRVGMPGAQAFSRQALVFTLVSVPGVPPFSAIWVTQADFGPVTYLHLNNASGFPDQINVWRDGELILPGLDPADYDDDPDGADFRIPDYSATPNTRHDWYAQRVVNGNASPPGPHVVYTPSLIGYWLVHGPRNLFVCISEHPDGTPVMQSATAIDQATTTYALAAEYPTTDTQAIGRMQMMLHGVLNDDPAPGHRTAEQYEHDLLVMKQTPDIPVQLHYQNKSYPVTVADVTPQPYDSPDDTSFTWQVVDVKVRQVGPWTIYPDNTDDGGTGVGIPAADFIYRYADLGLGDGDPLLVGHFDITALAGTPVGDDDAIVPGHTDTEGWV